MKKKKPAITNGEKEETGFQRKQCRIDTPTEKVRQYNLPVLEVSEESLSMASQSGTSVGAKNEKQQLFDIFKQFKESGLTLDGDKLDTAELMRQRNLTEVQKLLNDCGLLGEYIKKYGKEIQTPAQLIKYLQEGSWIKVDLAGEDIYGETNRFFENIELYFLNPENVSKSRKKKDLKLFIALNSKKKFIEVLLKRKLQHISFKKVQKKLTKSEISQSDQLKEGSKPKSLNGKLRESEEPDGEENTFDISFEEILKIVENNLTNLTPDSELEQFQKLMHKLEEGYALLSQQRENVFPNERKKLLDLFRHFKEIGDSFLRKEHYLKKRKKLIVSEEKSTPEEESEEMFKAYSDWMKAHFGFHRRSIRKKFKRRAIRRLQTIFPDSEDDGKYFTTDSTEGSTISDSSCDAVYEDADRALEDEERQKRMEKILTKLKLLLKEDKIEIKHTEKMIKDLEDKKGKTNIPAISEIIVHATAEEEKLLEKYRAEIAEIKMMMPQVPAIPEIKYKEEEIRNIDIYPDINKADIPEEYMRRMALLKKRVLFKRTEEKDIDLKTRERNYRKYLHLRSRFLEIPAVKKFMHTSYVPSPYRYMLNYLKKDNILGVDVEQLAYAMTIAIDERKPPRKTKKKTSVIPIVVFDDDTEEPEEEDASAESSIKDLLKQIELLKFAAEKNLLEIVKKELLKNENFLFNLKKFYLKIKKLLAKDWILFWNNWIIKEMKLLERKRKKEIRKTVTKLNDTGRISSIFRSGVFELNTFREVHLPKDVRKKLHNNKRRVFGIKKCVRKIKHLLACDQKLWHNLAKNKMKLLKSRRTKGTLRIMIPHLKGRSKARQSSMRASLDPFKVSLPEIDEAQITKKMDPNLILTVDWSSEDLSEYYKFEGTILKGRCVARSSEVEKVVLQDIEENLLDYDEITGELRRRMNMPKSLSLEENMLSILTSGRYKLNELKNHPKMMQYIEWYKLAVQLNYNPTEEINSVIEDEYVSFLNPQKLDRYRRFLQLFFKAPAAFWRANRIPESVESTEGSETSVEEEIYDRDNPLKKRFIVKGKFPPKSLFDLKFDFNSTFKKWVDEARSVFMSTSARIAEKYEGSKKRKEHLSHSEGSTRSDEDEDEEKSEIIKEKKRFVARLEDYLSDKDLPNASLEAVSKDRYFKVTKETDLTEMPEKKITDRKRRIIERKKTEDDLQNEENIMKQNKPNFIESLVKKSRLIRTNWRHPERRFLRDFFCYHNYIQNMDPKRKVKPCFGILKSDQNYHIADVAIHKILKLLQKTNNKFFKEKFEENLPEQNGESTDTDEEILKFMKINSFDGLTWKDFETNFLKEFIGLRHFILKNRELLNYPDVCTRQKVLCDGCFQSSDLVSIRLGEKPEMKIKEEERCKKFGKINDVRQYLFHDLSQRVPRRTESYCPLTDQVKRAIKDVYYNNKDPLEYNDEEQKIKSATKNKLYMQRIIDEYNESKISTGKQAKEKIRKDECTYKIKEEKRMANEIDRNLYYKKLLNFDQN